MGRDNQRQIATMAVYFATEEHHKGAKEIGGNNQGPFVEKYLNANHPDRITHQGEPWCAAFFCWCWLEVSRSFGFKLPIGYTRSAGVLFLRMSELHQVQLRASVRPESQEARRGGSMRAEPGDAVFFDRSGNGRPDHVSMVHHVDPDGNLHTIGGNEGTEDSGAPVQIKNRGPLLQVPHLFAVGWVLASSESE